MELDSLLQSTRYAKQKSKLQLELEDFLSKLSPSKLLADAFPSDIRKFLVFKDQAGKTMVHGQKCEFKGQQGLQPCQCPRRRSAGSVDSLIGQIRAIFRDYGRGTCWNADLGVGNPAAAPCVKNHLKAIRLEQSAASVLPRQAKPLFLSKLSQISRHLSFQLRNPKHSVYKKYLLMRDLTFFNILSYSGDRAGDLAGLTADQIFFLPDNNGIIFTLTKGKTISASDPRDVVLCRSNDAEFCPVKLLRDYLEFCKRHNLIKNNDFVFRSLQGGASLSEQALTSSAVNARLKLYLNRLHLGEGETPHGMRSACAIMLHYLGVDKETAKSHVGWKSDSMLDHYTKCTQISNKITEANVMSSRSMTLLSHRAETNVDLYRGKNSLEKVYK